jgi:hypothetical protein
MGSWEDVRRIALALPETSEQISHGNAQWRVRDKGFVWERPLRRSEDRALGDAAPIGPILVQLDNISDDQLEELIVEAWLARAPKRLAKQCVDTNLKRKTE